MTDEAREKLFSRTEYRRVIAWPERIRREAPFLAAALSSAPSRSVLDVGCATGEHTRHLAEEGWRAVGIDLSEKMLADAADHAGATDAGGSARYELRGAAEAATLPEAPFGAAVCLGNTFAFVEREDELDEFLAGVGAALAPRAPFLIQMLNYERIEGLPVRALPVNVRPLPEEEGEGEIVFLRVLRPREGRGVDFYPISLTLRPGEEEPEVEVRQARHFIHWAWKRHDLEPRLAAAGFENLRVLGGMAMDVPYRPMESPDLVILADRSAKA